MTRIAWTLVRGRPALSPREGVARLPSYHPHEASLGYPRWYRDTLWPFVPCGRSSRSSW